jgi:integrase
VLDEGHFPVTLRLMHLKRLKTGEVNIMYSLSLLIERNSQWGFESGRKTLEKSPLKEEQSRARLMESSRCWPLRRTHWFVAILINLIAETFVGERRGSMPRSSGHSQELSIGPASRRIPRNEARDRCLLLLMFRHCLRVSEACRMKLDQVDTESRVLHVLQ